MKTVIEMAREAGFDEWQSKVLFDHLLERFAKIVRADERLIERKKWMQVFTDPENQPSQFGTVTVEYVQREIADEREACAKVCENGVDTEHPTVKGHIMKDFGQSRLLATAIRARSNK